MKKVIRDGMVAVLYSPGYGAGWYSWNWNHPECVFDPNIVAMVEAGQHDQIEAYCKTAYGTDLYPGGAEQLKIEWIPVGTLFNIREYDGHESIEYQYSPGWLLHETWLVA